MKRVFTLAASSSSLGCLFGYWSLSLALHAATGESAQDYCSKQGSVSNGSSDMRSNHEYIKFHTRRPGHGNLSETMVVSYDGGLHVGGEKMISFREHEVVVNALQNKLQPPNCTSPGGKYLQYDGTRFVCVCEVGYRGVSCGFLVSDPIVFLSISTLLSYDEGSAVPFWEDLSGYAHHATSTQHQIKMDHGYSYVPPVDPTFEEGGVTFRTTSTGVPVLKIGGDSSGLSIGDGDSRSVCFKASGHEGEIFGLNTWHKLGIKNDGRIEVRQVRAPAEECPCYTVANSDWYCCQRRIVTTSPVVFEGQFQDVCVLGSNNITKIYKNAVLVQEWLGEEYAAFSWGIQHPLLGATNFGNRGFQGTIKKVGIWDRIICTEDMERFAAS